LLWHVNVLPGGREDEKLIGVYSSPESAERARQRSVSLPGFRDAPDGFHVDCYTLNEDHWTEGFVTETSVLICELQDTVTRGRFWSVLSALGAEEIRAQHYSDVGVEHWTFRIGPDRLTVAEDYGELIIMGPVQLVSRIQSAVRES
jgi:hypothetical protein